MQNIKATIIHRQMLTEHVMEFSIETNKKLYIIPGQRTLFLFEDEQGSFQRSYSIVDYRIQDETTTMTFAIKLSTHGRGSSIIRKMSLGDQISIGGVFGDFIVQDTLLPKVFIGTGMGILPLIAMAKQCTTKKYLFFSVSHKKYLFYENKIKNIPGLGYEIYLSQEHLPGYQSGRIDFIKQHFDPNTEFYLCGKAETIEKIIEKLTVLEYKRIYVEKF